MWLFLAEVFRPLRKHSLLLHPTVPDMALFTKVPELSHGQTTCPIVDVGMLRHLPFENCLGS